MIATDGDARLQIDPKTGLNAYGCSPRPRPWAITFSSSTASSISERGYAAAERAKHRLIDDAIHGGIEYCNTRETARICQAIGNYYGLSKEIRILIISSGTDGELLALGIALLSDPDRPLTNILVGPEESGSGVPLAAAGRHFSTRTARGVVVVKGDLIEGIPKDLDILSVPVRTSDGSVRSATEITVDCSERITEAILHGRRVLLHILDQSKTGLLAPNTIEPSWLRNLDKIDILVDASQARLAASSVRSYVEHGAMVLLTGSKFFTGPPFSGVLLVPPPISDRLEGNRVFPSGFVDYFGCMSVAESFDVSFGLALRWQAALAEMDAFSAIEETVVAKMLYRFGNKVENAIKANPDLYWHETAPLNRTNFKDNWDQQKTIFTFSIWRPADSAGPRRLFHISEARQIYIWLNSDLSDLLPIESSTIEQWLAAQYVHIGQPVALATKFGMISGALRLSSSARLVSGDFSQRHPDTQIDRAINDALTAIEKVSLIVRYFERIRSQSAATVSMTGYGLV